MGSFKKLMRRFLWRILGFDYTHIQRINDSVFLKEDGFATIGEKSYDNNAIVYRWSDAPLIIGKYCSISYGVKFILDDGHHKVDIVSSYPFKSNDIGEKRGIKIGNDVWIGMNAIILNGITIGNGVTIAAGSVVTKDVPDYCVVAGVPGRIVKRKCTLKEAEQMNKIAWWDWDKKNIDRSRSLFALSIHDFILNIIK